MDHAGLGGVADDALRGLEVGHLQLGLTVRALLEGQLVLERRHLDLVVGEEGLTDHDGQERAHHQDEGDDLDDQSPPGGLAIPRPDEPQERTAGRVAWVAA